MVRHPATGRTEPYALEGMGRQTVTTMGAGAKVDLAGLMKKLAAAHPYTGLSSDITISADASLVLGKTKLCANTV